MPPPVSSVHLSSWDTCSCLDATSCLTKKSGVRQWVPTSKNCIIVPTSISMVLLRSGGREYHWMTIIVKACRDRCNDDHCRRWYYRRASSVARLSSSNWCRQNCWLSCHAYLIELVNTMLTVVSSKKWCHFLTTAGPRRPLFSPANGQFFISTWRLEASSRGIPPVLFNRALNAFEGENVFSKGREGQDIYEQKT